MHFVSLYSIILDFMLPMTVVRILYLINLYLFRLLCVDIDILSTKWWLVTNMRYKGFKLIIIANNCSYLYEIGKAGKITLMNH